MLRRNFKISDVIFPWLLKNKLRNKSKEFDRDFLSVS
jgi:hypothetical protein